MYVAAWRRKIERPMWEEREVATLVYNTNVLEGLQPRGGKMLAQER